jgi:hypothetical protein
MSTPKLQTVLKLVAGESSIPVVRLVWGEAASTLAVGSEGDWPVRAAGVAPRHVNFAFDGRQLFVASAGPGLAAYMAGLALDGNWRPVQLPAQVQFGAALVEITCEEYAARPSAPAPPAPPATPQVPPARRGPDPGQLTVREGAGAWEAAHEAMGIKRPQHPAPGPAPSAPPSVPPVAAPGPVEIRMAPPQAATIVAPKSLLSAVQPPQAHAPVQPPPQQAHAQPNVVAMPEAVAQVVPGLATTFKQPLGPRAPVPAIAPGPDLRDLHMNMAPFPIPPAAAQSPVLAAPIGDVTPPLATPAVMPPGSAPDHPYPGAEMPGVPAKPSGWKAISPVKKAIAVLLPVAFAVLLWPEEPEPPAHSPAAPTLAAATVPAVPSAALARAPELAAGEAAPSAESADRNASAKPAGALAAASATSAPSAPPRAATGPATAKGMPAPSASAPLQNADAALERRALDAAFEGRFDDAAAVYEELARTRDNEPVFREAARILRQRNARPR